MAGRKFWSMTVNGSLLRESHRGQYPITNLATIAAARAVAAAARMKTPRRLSGLTVAPFSEPRGWDDRERGAVAVAFVAAGAVVALALSVQE